MEQQSAHRPRLCVLAPTPLLMVEVEPGEDEDYEHSADLHLHPGGQGLWVARMAISLGAEVTVCGPFGGEVGAVLAHMLSEEKLTVRAVPYNAGNGAYVHDRRGGDRATLAHMVPPQLTRHELDDLYGTVLVEALESDVLVLTGAEPDRVLPAGFFSRLVRDVRSVDKPIVADLSGDAAKAAAAEGPTVLKMSHEELQAAGLTTGDSVEELQAAGRRLVEQGVGAMLISRAGEPTLLVTMESTRLLVGPVVTPLDHRGAGDSMTAGVAVALGRGASVGEAARLGAAAGALNVTRRGLGTGRREQIERFADRIGIEVVPWDDRGRAEA
ncbi:1-phosphofructokinase family hexose kinase [Oceanitalea stevensii]|uniref:Phosphofructokinase n=1 Tax=Oceanitalea stevensii TaxID=2763072 RepID=A0ABR8Z1S5_9MICO|nr:PfkB family carbohydrate kinase [Oceanitalea stevensii]MBD8061814.1 phosphofructokinase [Oceanitalea stevensii]